MFYIYGKNIPYIIYALKEIIIMSFYALKEIRKIFCKPVTGRFYPILP